MTAENKAKVDTAVDESSVPVPIQVERLRAEFELEKQRIANRGHWFGASIGVLGAVAVAGIGLIFRPASLEPIPPSKQIIELEEKLATLAKRFDDVSKQLSGEQSLQQTLRAEISGLNKQLGDASGVQQKLNGQIKQLQEQQKSSPQTLLTVYPFSRQGSVEDCRERAVGAIAELGFKRLSSPNPDVVAGNGEDVAAILCVTGSIVIAGPEGDYLMQSVKWLQWRMQSK